MEPGVRPRTPGVQPLERISPSRFTSIQKCALREVWASARQPALLPSAPGARLGTVIHRLLEKVGKGQMGDGSLSEAEGEWSSLVEKTERGMQDSWLERRFVPLSNSVPDYEVRKIKALQRAVEMAWNPGIRRPDTESVPASGRELWVQSEDGLVGGFIDHVQATWEGPVLRDYKSGHITHSDNADGSAAVRPDFQAQLKLYAALYRATHGTWPVRLEIVPLQGPAVNVPFEPEECTQLLQQAGALLEKTNTVVSKIGSLPHAGYSEETLAGPGPYTCRFCQFRPVCTAYQRARDTAEEAGWPQDVWGTVTEVRRLGNGRWSLRLNLSGRVYASARIRSLSPDTERHPALQIIRDGDNVAFYNLKPTASPGTFNEGPSTVLYQIPLETRPASAVE